MNTFACKFAFTLIQINLIGFKCTFVPSIHSSHINLNLNEPSFSQIDFCTFQSCPLQLYCTLAPLNHSNQTLYNSNMYFTPHTTHIKPSLTQTCPCTPNTLKSSIFIFKICSPQYFYLPTLEEIAHPYTSPYLAQNILIDWLCAPLL